ncbi:helix-turn-helix domain-containing protein [Yersinia proxima]|uniref:DNA-binding transcriptional regulator n=1 Tax=Yersinia proxima TaxID=2890316 RepID=A0ABW9EWJ7_9GAMM|nr:DNA-binding transcriptional regulator [Yersinia proxima]CNK58710.1 putative zinc finger/helix-turn-helix protein%2C YgiT family [Yersinia intermedia]
MSKILSSIHQEIQSLHEAGFIDTVTMQDFDAQCIDPVKNYSPNDIKAIREREKVSQPIFALYLNVSKKAVQKWERGETIPSSSALKLLSIVDKRGLQILA